LLVIAAPLSWSCKVANTNRTEAVVHEAMGGTETKDNPARPGIATRLARPTASESACWQLTPLTTSRAACDSEDTTLDSASPFHLRWCPSARGITGSEILNGTDRMQDIASSPTNWYEDDSDSEEYEYPIDQYEITASPNDFNVLTLFNFIESGAIKIPGFQRNYVWDLRRASKLIESLIIGLPVPQLFLYEEGRNRFLVIDGQQRLMSIYYFVKQRFPKKEKRPELRRIFEEEGKIPDETLHDDSLFEKFNLQLPPRVPSQANRFHRLNYATLGDYKISFDLRPIRNVIVKQVSPENDDSAIYEIFNRLNSGGVNLTPQEIRMSLYHSGFVDMLARSNLHPEWRRLVGLDEPDLHVKDVEFLLRGMAMLEAGHKYTESMVKFLNAYAKGAQAYPEGRIIYLENLLKSFLEACSDLGPTAFFSATRRFSVTIFEAVFVAACEAAYKAGETLNARISSEAVDELRQDEAFSQAAQYRTTSASNVKMRIDRGMEIVGRRMSD
jgi:hypothetical protein